MTKEALRREALGRRQALAEDERHRLSLRTCRRLLATAVWQRSRSVVAYVPIRAEVDTSLLLSAARDQGKALFLPRVVAPGSMVALPLPDPGALRPGFRGILEPPAEGQPATHADLIVVPGVAFSWEGVRLGYGAGYYDRFFATFPHAFRVGLLFGEQLYREIPREAHDVTMDALIVDGVWVRIHEAPALPREEGAT